MVPISNRLVKIKVCSWQQNGNLALSTNNAFPSLHPYLKHLPHPHRILSVMSLCLVGAGFHPSLSAFVVLKHPCLYICRKCVCSSSCIRVCHTHILFVSLSLESVCSCSHAWSFAAPRPPFVSSSLGCVCFCPPPSVCAVLKPPSVSSFLECVCFCPPPSVFAVLRPPLSPHL